MSIQPFKTDTNPTSTEPTSPSAGRQSKSYTKKKQKKFHFEKGSKLVLVLNGPLDVIAEDLDHAESAFEDYMRDSGEVESLGYHLE